MHRLQRLLITLPVLALPLLAAVPNSAVAAALSAEQGLHILAKAKAADGKCHYLSGTERRELSGYLARAEVASQGLMQPEAANTAIAEGRAAGKSARCSDRAGGDVKETLAAARLAVAQADGVEPAKPSTSETAGKPPKAGPVSLSEYADLTKPYFVDLRCKQLGGRKPRRYYEAIKDIQAAAIARYGKPAVVAAQSGASRKARGVTCGPGSLKMSEAGLAAVLRK